MPWLSWERHELRFNCRSSPWLEPAVVQLSSSTSLFCLCSDSSQQRWEYWFPALGKLCYPPAFTEFGSWFLLELRCIQAFTGWGISYFLLPGAETTVQKSHTLGAGCVHFPFPVPPVSSPSCPSPGAGREHSLGLSPPSLWKGFCARGTEGSGIPVQPWSLQQPGSPLWIPSAATDQGNGSSARGSSGFLPFPSCLCLLCPWCSEWEPGWLRVWEMLGNGCNNLRKGQMFSKGTVCSSGLPGSAITQNFTEKNTFLLPPQDCFRVKLA